MTPIVDLSAGKVIRIELPLDAPAEGKQIVSVQRQSELWASGSGLEISSAAGLAWASPHGRRGSQRQRGACCNVFLVDNAHQKVS